MLRPQLPPRPRSFIPHQCAVKQQKVRWGQHYVSSRRYKIRMLGCEDLLLQGGLLADSTRQNELSGAAFLRKFETKPAGDPFRFRSCCCITCGIHFATVIISRGCFELSLQFSSLRQGEKQKCGRARIFVPCQSAGRKFSTITHRHPASFIRTFNRVSQPSRIGCAAASTWRRLRASANLARSPALRPGKHQASPIQRYESLMRKIPIISRPTPWWHVLIRL